MIPDGNADARSTTTAEPPPQTTTTTTGVATRRPPQSDGGPPTKNYLVEACAEAVLEYVASRRSRFPRTTRLLDRSGLKFGAGPRRGARETEVHEEAPRHAAEDVAAADGGGAPSSSSRRRRRRPPDDDNDDDRAGVDDDDDDDDDETVAAVSPRGRDRPSTQSAAERTALELRAAMREALRQLASREPLDLYEELRRRSRRRVTGDENVRIRDHVKGKVTRRVKKVRRKVKKFVARPPVVKTVDKILFVGGVCWVAATEYVVLRAPRKMAAWYVASIAPLLAHRYVSYKKQGFIYFCLDFCYFTNALCVAYIVLSQLDDLLWAAFDVVRGVVDDDEHHHRQRSWVPRNTVVASSLDNATTGVVVGGVVPQWVHDVWRVASQSSASAASFVRAAAGTNASTTTTPTSVLVVPWWGVFERVARRLGRGASAAVARYLGGSHGPNDPLFRLVFALCNGPLLFAIIVWRNSYIFHSLDHVCSTIIHALPPLWTYTVRWGADDYAVSSSGGGACAPLAAQEGPAGRADVVGECHGFINDQPFPAARSFRDAVLAYVLWQALYIAKIEWLDRECSIPESLESVARLKYRKKAVCRARHRAKAKNDHPAHLCSTPKEERSSAVSPTVPKTINRYIRASPREYTSLRWLSRDSRGTLYKLCKAVLVRASLMRRDEEFDDATWRTKFTFWIAQFAYTLLTLLPVPVLWASRDAHCACLLVVYVAAVYNGASYYIEVFSRRYLQKFDKPPPPPPPSRTTKAAHSECGDDPQYDDDDTDSSDDDDAAAESETTTTALARPSEVVAVAGDDNVSGDDDGFLSAGEFDEAVGVVYVTGAREAFDDDDDDDDDVRVAGTTTTTGGGDYPRPDTTVRAVDAVVAAAVAEDPDDRLEGGPFDDAGDDDDDDVGLPVVAPPPGDLKHY